MEVTKKAVKRTLRDVKLSVEEIGLSDAATLLSKIKQFLTMCEENEILNFFAYEFFKAEIDIDEIEKDEGNLWIKLRLPSNKNDNLAYVLQLLKRFAEKENEHEMHNYAFKLYMDKQSAYNVPKVAQKIIYPSLLHFQNILEDFIEDNIEEEDLLIVENTPKQFMPPLKPTNKPGGIY